MLGHIDNKLNRKTINVQLLNILSVLFVFSSCSEEITHSRTAFPDIWVSEYVFNDEQGYVGDVVGQKSTFMVTRLFCSHNRYRY